MGELYIQNDTFSNENESIRCLKNVGFWIPLMTELLPIFTEVEVRCKESEKEVIHIIKPFAHTIRFETDLVIFTMPLNQKLRELFLQSTSTNKIMWFSLRFKKYGYHICSVEYYGAELHFNQITNLEAIQIQSFFQKDTVFQYKE